MGLLDQQNSFFGKVLLHVAVFGILLFRTSSDVEKYKNLVDEATFYDKQVRGDPAPFIRSIFFLREKGQELLLSLAKAHNNNT